MEGARPFEVFHGPAGHVQGEDLRLPERRGKGCGSAGLQGVAEPDEISGLVESARSHRVYAPFGRRRTDIAEAEPPTFMRVELLRNLPDEDERVSCICCQCLAISQAAEVCV